jgi:hypothetical protein
VTRKNPVSALTIINPEDEKKFFGLENRDYKMIAIGAAAGLGGLWVAAHIRNTILLNTPRGTAPLLVTDQSVPVPSSSGVPGLLMLGLLGAAGWYVWSKYRSTAEAVSFEEPVSNPKKRVDQKRSSGTRYFVRVSGTNEIYPKPGSDSYPGGYLLKKAQDFARIGSKTGAPRKVLRGSPDGVVVRKYEDGKRVWPKTMAQASSLRPAERPSKLRKSA